jgi:predicted Fe-Mo cluster-binding NifX family protein
MKLAISSIGNTLDSNIDGRFGRCEYFIFYDTETEKFEAISNEATQASGGAGVQAAQLINNKGAEVVLTGNVGPNAMSVLSAAKIGIAVGVSGTVREAIDKFIKGEYELAKGPSVPPHSGLGRL